LKINITFVPISGPILVANYHNRHVFNQTGANITFPEFISLNKDYSNFVDISTQVKKKMFHLLVVNATFHYVMQNLIYF
jgi:hypothetical protein